MLQVALLCALLLLPRLLVFVDDLLALLGLEENDPRKVVVYDDEEAQDAEDDQGVDEKHRIGFVFLRRLYHGVDQYGEDQDTPEEHECDESHFSVYWPPLIVDFGPNSENPPEEIRDEDDVENVNPMRPNVVVVLFAATAPLTHVNLGILLKLPFHALLSSPLLFQDGFFHGIDSDFFLFARVRAGSELLFSLLLLKFLLLLALLFPLFAECFALILNLLFLLLRRFPLLGELSALGLCLRSLLLLLLLELQDELEVLQGLPVHFFHHLLVFG